MPAALEPAQLSPMALGELLRKLPPRPSALLRRRLARGASLEACATFYAVAPEAFSIHLLREAQALTAAAGGTTRTPENEEEEAAWARQLSAALDRDTATVSPALADTVALCRRMQAVGPAVEAALEAAERAELASPRRKREDLVRRLVVGLLLALAAYFYLTRPPEPPARPARALPSSR
jgi:hypothetical protein